MLVQCPKCKTTYKVSDDVVRAGRPSFRCSRCKHTFELAPDLEAGASTSGGGPEKPREDSDLAFAFESTPPVETGPAGKESPRQLETSNNPLAQAGGEPESNQPPDRGAVEASIPVAAPTAEESDSEMASPSAEKEPLALTPPAQGPNDRGVVTELHRDQAASVRPFLTLFVLLGVFFAFLAAYQKTHPTAVSEWLRSIPFLRESVLRNDQVKNGVLLKSVETKYQNLQGSREVVVLTGVAVNQNPVMIRNVQLAGQLYDHDGKEIERQTMWIGNAISAQIIRGMTAQDIVDLQRLRPLKTFEIPSGDSVPFAIVFLRAGKQVKDARCEVLSAEADV
jgi:predicted Zn finger-like uncharacterized protein